MLLYIEVSPPSVLDSTAPNLTLDSNYTDIKNVTLVMVYLYITVYSSTICYELLETVPLNQLSGSFFAPLYQVWLNFNQSCV